MAEWVEATDRFVAMNDMEVLFGPGQVASEDAIAIAHDRFTDFDTQRRALETARADEEAEQEFRELLADADAGLLDELEKAENEVERRHHRFTDDD
ncbi:hypothetical protein [Rhizohabitans arisaemae]|uniref:hypothetical protein n=1 Tax=Rhizohabitans arisaemae TaxID=2720610 RepID=UPI0024B25930|nr:hypothetical protein [Rhizohabitans arisaemae]